MKKSPTRSVSSKVSVPKNEVFKLDIRCGDKKEIGFIGIDPRNLPGVDIVWDIEKFPWPIADGVVDLASAAHVVQYLNPLNHGMINFMDEVWRILKYGGQMRLSTVYAGSTAFFSDPEAVNPCTAHTFYYFDPLAPSGLYRKYKPKPWKIESGPFWNPDGIMEVLLSKRREDPSYLKS